MKLINYLGKKVRVTLANGFYYIGLVRDTDENSIELLDINQNLVSIKEGNILRITEVNK